MQVDIPLCVIYGTHASEPKRGVAHKDGSDGLNVSYWLRRSELELSDLLAYKLSTLGTFHRIHLLVIRFHLFVLQAFLKLSIHSLLSRFKGSHSDSFTFRLSHHFIRNSQNALFTYIEKTFGYLNLYKTKV